MPNFHYLDVTQRASGGRRVGDIFSYRGWAKRKSALLYTVSVIYFILPL
jgi:hypothetical protein